MQLNTIKTFKELKYSNNGRYIISELFPYKVGCHQEGSQEDGLLCYINSRYIWI